MNQDVEIEVVSTDPMKYVSYQVLGRGDVILAATVPVPGLANSVSFRFLATYAMAPTAHVIVQYVLDDGEVVADALDIQLDGVLQNFVSLLFLKYLSLSAILISNTEVLSDQNKKSGNCIHDKSSGRILI